MTPALPSPPPQPDAGMGATQYRKRPVVITATQWFKHGDHAAVERVPLSDLECDFGWVKTLEGGHMVTPGDWIITGVKGEHYPCKPDIFAATYEPASRAPAPPGPAATAGEVKRFRVVTDEMVHAAVETHARLLYMDPQFSVTIEDAMKAALEAALAVRGNNHG